MVMRHLKAILSQFSILQKKWVHQSRPIVQFNCTLGLIVVSKI